MKNNRDLWTNLRTFVWALLYVCVGSSTVSAARLKGVVQSGQGADATPLARIKVTLYEATRGRPRVVGSAKTNPQGKFNIKVGTEQTDSIFFASADVKLGVRFVSVLGPSLPNEITINELTSVAASYSMAQFYRRGYISGDAFGLRIAASMNDNIVDVSTGDSSPVILSSPNADETHSLRMTRSLANLLSLTLDRPFFRFLVLILTTPAEGAVPLDTAEGLANLARDPARNVEILYRLSQLQDTYTPDLARQPDAWTVTIKVNDSGDDRFLFGGPANVAFDARGYAWVANNVKQGTPDSARVIMALKPNGMPADGGPGLPTSPVAGGGILGVGWGITVDPFENVWIGNFGWGDDFPDDCMDLPEDECQGNGSVTQLLPNGSPVSTPRGYFGGTYRVQAIKSDAVGNMWMASFGNDRVVAFPDGNPYLASFHPEYNGAAPFGLAVDSAGAAWVTNSGGLAGFNQSSVGKYFLDEDGQVQREFLIPVGHTLKVIDIDSQGNAWFCSQGNHRVYAMRPDGSFFKRLGFSGGGMDGPWGLTVDGEDNIWISNFGPIEFASVFTTGGLTKLAGVQPPQGMQIGDPLTPDTGYTVHTAGSQVLLHDGTPLNGPDGEPSFTPIMRQTSLQIDQAGNIWSINNWKPKFLTDVVGFNEGRISPLPDPEKANPGGDGIIIFVGLAPPPARR